MNANNSLIGCCTRRERVSACGVRHQHLDVVASDPDDDKFVECALVAGASVIVSGDHHLLELGRYENLRIFSVAEFVAFCRSCEY